MYAMETFRASSSGGDQMLLRDEEPADPTVVFTNSPQWGVTIDTVYENDGFALYSSVAWIL